jgi:hypothetical protein
MHGVLGDLLLRESVTQPLNGVVELRPDLTRRLATIQKDDGFFHEPQSSGAVLLQRTRSVTHHTHPCAN